MFKSKKNVDKSRNINYNVDVKRNAMLIVPLNYAVLFVIIYYVLRRKNMKSTGVVRKVDELGRIVLPIEIRKILDIKQKDAIEIFTDNDKIILQKYQPACVFCNNIENIVYFNGKRVCADCVEKLKTQF